ncbi:MAG: SDR family oxidoreductase [Acidimicrobiia bacterium]
MKTVLVTGATDGIGRETAHQLLERGLRVLVHGRTLEKASRVVVELKRATPAAQVESVYADLADMREVLGPAQKVREKTPVLDVLINNAGVYAHTRVITSDGFELTMAVNHFAPFLLTHELLYLLQGASQGRIITVSSIAHQSGRLDLDDLTFARRYDGYDAYAASKLANILFTGALAKRLDGTSVTANSLHPGVISTKLLHKGFGFGGAPVQQGARTSVYLATSEEVNDIRGAYFEDCRRVNPSRMARDERLAEALWEKSQELLAPRMRNI